MQTCRSKAHPSLVDPRLQKKASSTTSPKIRTATTAPIAVKNASAGANTINEKKVPSVGANTINEKKGSSEGANTINGKKPPGVTSIDVFFKETLDVINNEKKKMDGAAKNINMFSTKLLEKNIEINQVLMAGNKALEDKIEGLCAEKAALEEKVAHLTQQLELVTKREANANLEAAVERKRTAAERVAKEAAQTALNKQIEQVATLTQMITGYSSELREMKEQLKDMIDKFEVEKKKLEADCKKAQEEINAALQPLRDENATLKKFSFDASAKIGVLQARNETLESELDLKNSSAGSLAAKIGAAIGGHANGAMLWRECHDAYNREYARLTYGCVAPQRKREHADDDQELKIPPPSTSPSEASCSSPHGDTENHGHKRRRNE